MSKKARRNQRRHEEQVRLMQQQAAAERLLRGTSFYGVQISPDYQQTGGVERRFGQGGLPGLGKR